MLLTSLAFLAMQAQPVRAEENRSYNFVNFGYSESSNTWYHEQDILSFANGLFDPSSTHILSAGGPNTRFVDNDGNGNFLRRPDGALELRNSSLAAGVLKASAENYRAMYQRLASEKSDSALVVIGDHGSSFGLGAWTDDYAQGGQTITPQAQFDLIAKIPPGKTVQHIYLQCFAGSMLVDQTRQVPQTSKDLNSFLDKYYPANRCGLALSRHDEMGQYNQNGKDWRHSAWTDYFKTVNPISLQTMKSHLNGDPDLAPTTVLTSDYLAEDILKYACHKDVRAELEDCAPGGSNGRFRSAGAATFAQVCGMEDVNKDLEARQKATERAFNAPNIITIFKGYWISEYLKKQDPAFGENMRKQEKVSYNTYRIYSEPDMDAAEKESLTAESEKLLSELPPNFHTTVVEKELPLHEGKVPAFEEFYRKNCTLEFMKAESTANLVPSFMRESMVPPAGKTCDAEKRRLFDDFRRIQTERKQAERRALELREKLVQDVFAKNPSLKSLKERYDNVKKCENDSLK